MKLILTVILLLLMCGQVWAADPHACDTAAAHKSDPDKVGPGIGSTQVVVQVAIPACREAVAEFPEVARFHYQLGRALVYWADANKGDTTEGVKYVKQAADMGHTQSIFVLGLMYQRENESCKVETLFKQAADMGLKSARISYVNEYISGGFETCELSASNSEMQQYLSQAREQVSGYYEGMLLNNLEQQLK